MKNKILVVLICSFVTPFTYGQTRLFTGKPQYDIVTVEPGNDTLGVTRVELFPNIAPLHTQNFDSLVSYNFYDSTAFHRVIPGFMIQGGDPNSRHGAISTWGMGDTTQPTVNAEFTAAKHLRGILSAARDTDINSANSQFFICVAPAAWLNGSYSVYGRVVAGMNYVDTIVNRPRDINDNPLQKIEMFVRYVGSNDSIPNAPVLTLPLNNSYNPSTGRTLKWNAEPDGIIYHVQVSTDSTFTTCYKNLDVGTNLYTVTGLTPGNKYYWHVNTNNGGHWSPTYSPIWNFTVGSLGIIESEEVQTINVYPNPSSDQFIFSDLEKESTIEIFDIVGKSIYKTMVDEELMSIDLKGNAKGMYFVRITNKYKQIKQGKIILE